MARARAYAGSDSNSSRVTCSARMKADASWRNGYFARPASSTVEGTHVRLKRPRRGTVNVEFPYSHRGRSGRRPKVFPEPDHALARWVRSKDTSRFTRRDSGTRPRPSHSPAASRRFEAYGNFWFSRLARKVDLILALDDAPSWPNVRRIKPIVRPFSASREQLREDLFFRKKTILVTVGGTAIGEYLIRDSVKAFRALAMDDVSMVIVSGPKLKAEPEAGVYTYGFLPNLQDYVLAADLVITTGGKGTVREALAAGTPVIAIPTKVHVEAERNAAALGYRHEDLGRLRELIVEKLALGRLPPRINGNAEAIQFLLEFLESKVESR